MNNKIYLDYNSTTPIDPSVFDEILPYLKNNFGNPSSIHSYGNEAKAALDNSREKVAQLLNVKTSEITFTNGGSEGNNHAIKGAAISLRNKGDHLITTQTEHASCMECFRFLELKGFEVTYLTVDSNGIIDLDHLHDSITDKTILISCMHVNNETGVINPIDQIGEIARSKGVTFHTDAIQALGKIDINLSELPVDIATFSSHKIYGPKGIGAIYIKKGLNLSPLIHGGGQERGKRAGTENIVGIVGFGKACEILKDNIENEQEKIGTLRDSLEKEILSQIKGSTINGNNKKRVKNTTNISFNQTEGESVVINLDLEGIAVSTGSACSEGNVDPSHVLLAMGLTKEEALSSIRFSLGRFSKESEVENVIKILPNVIERIRKTKI